jgi:hypothetical protein
MPVLPVRGAHLALIGRAGGEEEKVRGQLGQWAWESTARRLDGRRAGGALDGSPDTDPQERVGGRFVRMWISPLQRAFSLVGRRFSGGTAVPSTTIPQKIPKPVSTGFPGGGFSRCSIA